jgi:putative Ca2+/H+ antiporter (TMEM165/GDT1 family)
MKVVIILAFILTLCQCSELIQLTTNTTVVRDDIKFPFGTSVVKSFSVTFMAEVADKTFILLLFYSMRMAKVKLILLSLVSLLGMNLLTVILGGSIPLLLYANFIDWVALILFFIFSIMLFEEAYHMDNKTLKTRYDKYTKKHQKLKEQALMRTLSEPDPSLRERLLSEGDAEIEHIQTNVPQQEDPRLVWSFFTSLMVAECGDRSMFSTLLIAAVYDFWGVLLGSTVAHIICILLAIFMGSFLSNYVTEKQTNYIGGALFLFFAIEMVLLKFGIFAC